MSDTLKIVIPTAGWATRMRPQTWSKPKPLVGMAGRTVLDYLLATFKTLPSSFQLEHVFILGPYLGETQIPPYLAEHYPELILHYAVQRDMRGQSDALRLAAQWLSGRTIVLYSDTLIETDFSFLENETADGIAWVQEVADPRRFGVAELDENGWVKRLIEKPDSLDNRLVVVGCYYFREGRDLLSAIEEQIRRDVKLKGEYFLTDAVNIMLEGGARMRTREVVTWLDTGTITATLATNRALLEHGTATDPLPAVPGVTFLPPVAVHPTAQISGSVIGPYASIGAQCIIRDSRVQDSIIEAGAIIERAALKGSFIGRQARIHGRSSSGPPMVLNVGDNSNVGCVEIPEE